MAVFSAGHTLGKYKVLRLLGSGGMADVYEAEDTMLGRHVALKVLPSEYSRNDQLVRRFETEVKQSALLNHRSIVTVYDFGQDGSHLYYSMRLLTGGDLRKRIEEGMTPLESLGILRDLSDAFAHAHKRTVHRDVKPENIVFDEQGLPVITDFGIAKALDASTKVTATGVAVGTPRYLSPEQARGKPVDKRADIYSLGVILYEMLTGKPPYDAEEALAVVFKHVTEPVPELPANLQQLQPLLNSMMEKDPQKRMASCEDLIVALDELIPSFMPSDLGQGGTRSNPWMPRMSTPSPLRTPGGGSAPTPTYRTGNQPTVITAPPVQDAPPRRKSLFDQPRVTTGETMRHPGLADQQGADSQLGGEDQTRRREAPPPPRPKTPMPAPRPATPPPASNLGEEDETRMRAPPKPRDPGQSFPQRARPSPAPSSVEVTDEEMEAAAARGRPRAAPAAAPTKSKAPLIAATVALLAIGGVGLAYFTGAFKPKPAAPQEAVPAPAPAPAATEQPAAAAPAAAAPTVTTHAPAPAPAPAAAAPDAAEQARINAARQAEVRRQEELQRQAQAKDAEIKRQAEARHAQDEAAAKHKQDEQAAAAAAAAKKKQDEDAAAATAAAKKKQDEEAAALAARKKQQEEEAARRKQEEDAAAAAAAAKKKKEEQDAAAAEKRRAEEDAADQKRAQEEADAARKSAADRKAAEEARKKDEAKKKKEAAAEDEKEKAKKRAAQQSGF